VIVERRIVTERHVYRSPEVPESPYPEGFAWLDKQLGLQPESIIWEDEEGEVMDLPPDANPFRDPFRGNPIDRAVAWLQDRGAVPSSSSFFPGMFYGTASRSGDDVKSDCVVNVFHLRGFTRTEERDVFEKMEHLYPALTGG